MKTALSMFMLAIALSMLVVTILVPIYIATLQLTAVLTR
jgi:hypothetical protein